MYSGRPPNVCEIVHCLVVKAFQAEGYHSLVIVQSENLDLSSKDARTIVIDLTSLRRHAGCTPVTSPQTVLHRVASAHFPLSVLGWSLGYERHEFPRLTLTPQAMSMEEGFCWLRSLNMYLTECHS